MATGMLGLRREGPERYAEVRQMNDQIRKAVFSFTGGFVTGFLADWSLYSAAKKQDPKAKFDFTIAVPRWIGLAVIAACASYGWQAS